MQFVFNLCLLVRDESMYVLFLALVANEKAGSPQFCTVRDLHTSGSLLETKREQNKQDKQR